MIKVKNTNIVEDIHKAYASKTKRAVSFEAGTYEKTMDIFEREPETMNPSTIGKIADHFGYDTVISFVKRNGDNGAEKAESN